MVGMDCLQTLRHILLGSTVVRSDVDIDMVLACYDLLDEIALTFLQNMQRRGTLILKDRGLECISKNTLKRAFDDDHEV